MKTRLFATAVMAPVVLVAACGEAPSDEGIVARVGDYTLPVDVVVELLVDEETLPAQAGVVQSLVNLWVDYTLLAEAVAEDSTFSDLDLEALVRQQVEQTMIFQLRDSIIQVDTLITDDELLALYEADAPDVQLRARHVMLTYPVQATAGQRDSVRAQLEGLRARILSGTAFEQVARDFSQDQGTAPNGGDLGFFSRGDMVRPFEDAVLELEPGEVSEVVETPLGLHVIRLEERRVPDFAEIAPGFRTRVQSERYTTAESTFVSRLEERSGPETTDGAAAVVREMARNPGARLSGRAARRALVEWDGGAYTVGELLVMLQLEQQPIRDQIIEGSDEDIDLFLGQLARRDMLVDEATISGLEPPRARIDSLVTDAGQQLLQASRALGLVDVDLAPGEARALGIARAVREALEGNLSGGIPIVPLGPVGFQLRAGRAVVVSEAGVGSALLRIAQLRAERSPSPLEQAFDSTLVAPDTLQN